MAFILMCQQTKTRIVAGLRQVPDQGVTFDSRGFTHIPPGKHWLGLKVR